MSSYRRLGDYIQLVDERNKDLRVATLLGLTINKTFILSVANQLLRSGTSVGANTEEAQAGQSKADFIAKMSIAGKESRETLYWLRLLKATNLVDEDMIIEIIKESDELVRILTTIVKSSQKGKNYGK